jgi:8-oxo-dGTP pyrophosphatase MutT (NUDIX family)
MYLNLQNDEFDLIPTENVEANYTGSNIAVDSDTQKAINTHWDDVSRSGKMYTRGLVFGVTTIKHEGVTKISVGASDYAHYLYLLHGYKAPALRSLYTSCVIKTCDSFLCVGEMAEHTATPSRLQLPGGGVDHRHVKANGGIKLRQSIEDEMLEEIGVDISDKSRFHFDATVHIKFGSAQKNVGVIFSVNTTYTKEQLDKHFARHCTNLLDTGEQPELSALHFLPMNTLEVEQYLRRSSVPRVDYLGGILGKMTASN